VIALGANIQNANQQQRWTRKTENESRNHLTTLNTRR